METKVEDKSLFDLILEETLRKLTEYDEFPPEIIENLETLIEKNQFSNKTELLNAIKVRSERSNETD